MSDVARDIALVLSAAGGAVFVPKVLAALWRAVTGAPRRQRREIERVRQEKDDEAHNRRLAEEHASHLRRIALEASCIPVESIPPRPTYRKKKENPDEEAH